MRQRSPVFRPSLVVPPPPLSLLCARGCSTADLDPLAVSCCGLRCLDSLTNHRIVVTMSIGRLWQKNQCGGRQRKEAGKKQCCMLSWCCLQQL